ncbi:hypothetical protein BCR32DRAFT_293290 [Anaeromyces robustus]|uniref:CBM10 domain-containing protein n=1 Tax=Anaeromyces robustus TaxID=1754192 RepID=A0A1Y1X6M7_9FUNG|nr:hypothetical protein BCR32DRAFT_293290 [Anaeromyces robustus]|eukprot:ORX81440.1 hypothetical protein BCR32DRAFT_293290 [Anaeromyces robustus]
MILTFVLIILSIIISSLAKDTCWGEKLGYPCCPPTNCRIFYVNDDGDWGFHNYKWCAIDKKICDSSKSTETTDCWAKKFGYECCPPGVCEVSQKDENGSWGAYDGEWCGIIPSYCHKQD